MITHAGGWDTLHSHHQQWFNSRTTNRSHHILPLPPSRTQMSAWEWCSRISPLIWLQPVNWSQRKLLMRNHGSAIRSPMGKAIQTAWTTYWRQGDPSQKENLVMLSPSCRMMVISHQLLLAILKGKSKPLLLAILKSFNVFYVILCQKGNRKITMITHAGG